MAYCYSCGSRVSIEDTYCPSCGVRQNGDGTILKGSKTVKGIILTDIRELSQKFKVRYEQVYELLNQYIRALSTIGLDYMIIDSGSYISQNPKSNVFNRNIKLNARADSWIAYSQLLTDAYCFAYDEDDKPIFLFIIGGDDIIPMPTVVNKCYASGSSNEGVNDRDVDADMLYSYLLDEATFSLIDSGDLYGYTPYFYIGRLPMGNDSSLEYLNNYLIRSIEAFCNGGVSIKSAYGQTDLTWKVASSIVSSSLNELNLLPTTYEKLPVGYSYLKLITTPNTSIGDIDKVLNPYANLLYFNLHGSNIPTASAAGYFGSNGVCGISPNEVHVLQNPNIFVTEACYGARFIELDTNQSMLLSAFSNNTIAFMGSSRIAWGQSNAISHADIICKVFIEGILSGMCFGQALQYAKKVFVKASENLGNIHQTSLLEFNLYGDPALMAKSIDNSRISNKMYCGDSSALCPIADESVNIVTNMQTIFDSNKNSILTYIRGKVDSAFAEIKDKISQSLYEQHGLEPRQLFMVKYVTYRDNLKEYQLFYGKEGVFNSMSIVTADLHGNIKDLIVSK